MSSDSSSESSQTRNSIAIQISKKLFEQILTEEQIQNFSCTLDTDDRILYVERLIREQNLLPDDIPLVIPKNNEESLKYCNEGDQYFVKKANNTALEYYNKCIAYAEINSEFLSIGYLKRSQVFFRLNLHEQCLRDIQLASDTNYCPNNIKDELEKCRKNCETIIQNLPSTSAPSTSSQWQKNMNFLTTLTYPKHPNIPFIANCLELIESSEYGRSIITNCDLKPGDVIAIEKPYASTLQKTFEYRFCTNCLRETYSLIPCSSCTTAMFCNQKCLKKAYEKFHKYECQISNYLDEVLSIRLTCVRILIQTILLFKDIDRLIDFENKTVEDINIFKLDSSYFCSTTDVEDKDDMEMNELNYYPFYGLTKNVTNLGNLSAIEHICFAVYTVLANNLLIEILKDIIITDEHKRFVRNFIHRQLEAARVFLHGIEYCDEVESGDSPWISHIKYGTAMYPFNALINHSCAPNVLHIYNGSTITIIVFRPISKGEQIFDSYGENYWLNEKSVRQESLKSVYGFDCKCEACENDFPLYENLPIISTIPKLDLSTAMTDLYVVNEAIKDYFKYLNLYSNNDNYPCKQIDSVERKLEGFLSYSLRHR